MEYAELCVAKSFSLPRNLIAGIRLRARALKMSMSSYLAALVHNDLVYGIERPFSISPRELPLYPEPPRSAEALPVSPGGVVIPEFELEE
jgi:hypothetical protein